MLLTLSIYTPSHYILPSKLDKYAELYDDNKVNVGFTQANREQGIRRLMAINLMKRMESSVYAFSLTLKRISQLISTTIETINRFDKKSSSELTLTDISNLDQFDGEDMNDDLFSFGKKVKIDLADMDYASWKHTLQKDKEVLELISIMVADITPEHDSKLQELLKTLVNKINNPINEGNKKIIIFTAFADTAEYLFANTSAFFKNKYGLNTAMVTGSVDGRSTANIRNDLNTVLTCFSPISKDKELLMPGNKTEIDLLIATDCISEGQNLQDCDYLINYDIHWNPVRIIQRFGRIDRIGSKNSVIQLVNFWPDVSLDEYIDLKAKVETRMKIVNMTATGDDNIISEDEKTDLEYRKAQLKRLQEEVVDIEEMSSGISIMDLGLNEFRLDLLEYIKHHPDIEKTPCGLHSVALATEDTPAGVIYVLKNRSDSVNIDNQNRLHPFYMVYITNDGEVVCDHLSPKDMLDKMRYLCKGKREPIPEAYRPFNKETKDGSDMRKYSKLLGEAISSIIEVKEESDIDSFLGGSQMSFLANEIKGLDDFELICFLVVRDGGVAAVPAAPAAPVKPAAKKDFKLVVAGTRYFNNYALVASKLDVYLADKLDKYNVTIICGDAQGADAMGLAYASNHGLKVEHFPAEWGKFGSAAGPIRNKKMAQNADAVIVFWDGKSPGTKNMIKNAKAEGLPCTIINI